MWIFAASKKSKSPIGSTDVQTRKKKRKKDCNHCLYLSGKIQLRDFLSEKRCNRVSNRFFNLSKKCLTMRELNEATECALTVSGEQFYIAVLLIDNVQDDIDPPLPQAYLHEIILATVVHVPKQTLPVRRFKVKRE